MSNINSDGSVPAMEAPNWSVPGLNNYRQNIQPQGEFAAPDLIATIYPRCEGPYGIIARVRNIGSAAAPAGIGVDFYAGDPDGGGTKLGAGATSKILFPAEAEDVILDLADPPPGFVDNSVPAFVVINDTMEEQAWAECRTNNNKVKGSGFCPKPG